MIKFAFIFPGQGSQKVGMLSDIAVQYPIVKKTFHEASIVLGYNLWKLVQNGPSEELNKTQKTQPALLASSVAIWRIWKAQNRKAPLLMAGHSLGEYSALVCAEAINFTDAIYLVEMRGKLMQEAVSKTSGAMAAIIGLDDKSILNICKKLSKNQVVSPVNFNSPGQVVIAGHKDAVERAQIVCKTLGAKRTFLLPISVPSHCKLMEPAARKLEIELKKISFYTATIPIVSSVDVTCKTEPNDIRKTLIRQLYSPVQWTKTIEFISKWGIKHLYEVGPGKTLSNLTKRITNNLTASTLNDLILY